MVHADDAPAEPGPATPTAAALVAEQAARTPDAPAVTFAGTTLSFAELAREAAGLARTLRRAGVGRGSLVAIHLERSSDVVVALLGIMRAGGAYLPLDPGFPVERLALMLDDSAAAVIVSSSTMPHVVLSTAATVVLIDQAHWTEGRDEAPVTRTGPDDLAYVIYTSGSTGRPKGVEVPHRALSNLLLSMAERPGLGPADVLVAITTVSFDMAAPELWLPLVTGAHMVMASPDVARDPRRLIQLLDDSGATVLQATPPTWRMLLEAGWPGRQGFKALCGAEPLPVALADALLGRGLELWNLYGPTETTVWSTAEKVTTRGQAISIGHPMANTTLAILAPDLSAVAEGAAGELHIGGTGVTRGYLGLPGLTAERFVPDPSATVPGARVYRTGDVARWRPDGAVDFLGRLDHQVKVRGFRVECGEVEARLEAHPGVRAAIVVPRKDLSGETGLVAYVVLDSPRVAGQLRPALAASLPDHMVPGAFVRLDRLPLTPNGKVDRETLPAPPDARPGWAAPPASPRTATEAALTALWVDLLGISEIGVDDDFFDFGGHSLVAVRLVSRVRDALTVEVPVRAIFDAPTISGQGRLVDDLRAGDLPPVPPVTPVDRTPEARSPLAFAQEPLWFLDQLVPGNPFYNVPSAYRLAGALDVGALQRALDRVVSRHEALRTTFPAPGGRPHQRIVPPTPLALPVDDLQARGHEAEVAGRRLAAAEAAGAIDLARGPLVRARLLRFGPEDHVLLLTVHHIVTDGWSTGVLLAELSSLYGAFCRSAPSPLEDLPVQYADYATWQRRWLSGGPLEAQLAWWEGRLAGSSPVVELPPDHLRPPFPSFRGGLHELTVPAPLVASLRAVGRRRLASLHMTLLAAFKVLMAGTTGHSDIAVGTTTAGRTRRELEGLIGCFVNTLVLRTDLSGDPTFTDVLDRVRHTALEAYQHQDAPFEKVVERLAPPRDLSRNPLVQIAFELQEHLPRPSRLGGALALTDVGGPSGAGFGAVDGGGLAARLDLEVFLEGAADGSIEGALVYARDLYEPATMAGLVGSYLDLLAAIAGDPALRVSEVRLPSRREASDLLRG